jgi:Spy/CpxP family protein refolding chaperone
MSNKIISRGMVVLAVLAMTSLALAQGPRPMMEMQCGGGPCLPDLTEAQETQIEKSKLNLDKEILPLTADLDVKKAELDKLLLAEKPDKKAVYKKIDEIQTVKTKIKRLKVDHRLEVRALLTPEQRVVFDKQRSKRGMKHHGMGMMGEGGKKFVKIRKHMGRGMPMDVEEEIEVEEMEIEE